MVDEQKPAEDASNPEGEEVTVEQLQAKLAKAEEIADNYKVRAEKAEKPPKDEPKEEPAPKKEATEEQGLTPKDVLALTSAQVTDEEDVEQLLKMSKGFGITIAEALKDKVIRAKIEEAQEERKTAQATNTKGGAEGSKSKTEESLLSDASKGKMPESAAEIARITKARRKKL